MTISSTFLKSPLNFPSNNIKSPTKFDTFKEKSGVQFEQPERQFERTVRDKIDCKTLLE